MKTTTNPEGNMTAKTTTYYAAQIEGRPEDENIDRMWSVLEYGTDKVVASWRDTPIEGLTERGARELAEAWSRP